jgi:16S rRNA (uracil1498-N3)-methyltransferase
MPATPAWPPHSTPRLFVDELLTEDVELRIEGGQAHYLLNVMRMKDGAPVKLFDDRSGEYLAIVTATGKRDLALTVQAKLRDRLPSPDLWLCQALIKKDRMDWIAEKSCELGIGRFVPVLTRRCVVDKVKEDRLRLQMIEAAEQCERTTLPEIAPLIKLDAMLKDWPSDRTIYFCDERGGEPFGKVLRERQVAKAAILIGPEGGFTDEENAAIKGAPFALTVSLGPNILRADTAAVAAIAVWMSTC